MSIVSELTKERFTLMTTNPLRAKVVIPVLLNDAKDMAKRANREVSKEDIQASAKSYLKKLETTMKSYEGLPSSGPLDTIKQEIAEVKSFLPKMKTEEEVRTLLNEKLGLVKITAPQMGGILKTLPEDVDKGLASKILKEFM